MKTAAKKWIVCALGAAALMGTAPAHSEDFFSALFGGFGGQPTANYGASRISSFANEGDEGRAPRSNYPIRSQPVARSTTVSVTINSGSQSFCVRTCDGRYFPISATEGQSKAASCNNFCPASETKVFHGSTIDTATADNGKPYSTLPNAFKFRSELVAGCTCNGKDQIGLAPVKIENDPTLRKGDIVAGADGLMVNRGPDRRGASLNLSPVSASIRAKYERLPVVASE